MAGGSQIIINSDGIKIITPARLEAKAGQHLFKAEEKVYAKLPYLPKNQEQKYGLLFDVYDQEGKRLPSGTKYIVLDDTNKQISQGTLDSTGLVKLETTEPNKIYKNHVFT